MTTTACQRCKQDVTKAALVRCRDIRCPLGAEDAAASTGTWLGLLAIGALALLAVIVVGFTLSGFRHHDTAGARAGAVAAENVPTGGIQTGSSGGASGWMARMSALFVPPAKPQEDAYVDTQNAGPDPRAATRVQSFSCASAISPARALICTDWGLATADYNLSLAYQAALARSRSPEALRRSQEAWTTRLDKLGADPAAVQAAYQARYAELDH